MRVVTVHAQETPCRVSMSMIVPARGRSSRLKGRSSIRPLTVPASRNRRFGNVGPRHELNADVGNR